MCPRSVEGREVVPQVRSSEVASMCRRSVEGREVVPQVRSSEVASMCRRSVAKPSQRPWLTPELPRCVS
jgi:hypothetical protein